MAILLFPGQGSTEIQLNLNEPMTKLILEDAKAVLGYDLLALDDSQIGSTLYTQPNTFVQSIVLMQYCPKIFKYVAGHSLGQYAALVAAGFLDFKTALDLIANRSALMDKCCAAHPGSMVACLGDFSKFNLSNFNNIYPANYNSSQQTVVAGDSQEIDLFIKEAKENGLKCLKLRVAGAFHTQFMLEANIEMNKLIESTIFVDSEIGLISSQNGNILHKAQDVQNEMMDQIINPVKWTKVMETINTLKEEGNQIWDVGPGKVLGKLLKSELNLQVESAENYINKESRDDDA